MTNVLRSVGKYDLIQSMTCILIYRLFGSSKMEANLFIQSIQGIKVYQHSK